ncbi:DNA binding protein [Mycobacterium Phage Niklas]|uniref:DNA binding protein n=1 Tax=Mycobacterium Phage Niklas TaxID=2517936 RepID=A0A482JHI2_9CAUD|nr:DNA binding protein [Mycobacterium Phage Niklas]QBP31669.1 DNA binding protein [Mycobacterium Phage Niklas]
MADATLTVRGDRQHGKTTALLDVALANARRGLDVAFWSPTATQSHEAFRRAVALLPPYTEAPVVSGTNGRQSIRYARGAVRFVWGHHGRLADPYHHMTIHDADGEAVVTRPGKGL